MMKAVILIFKKTTHYKFVLSNKVSFPTQKLVQYHTRHSEGECHAVGILSHITKKKNK